MKTLKTTGVCLCGGNTFVETNEKTGERYSLCSTCGREEHLSVLEGAVLHHDVIPGYGVCYIVYKSGFSSVHKISKRFSEKKKRKLLTRINGNGVNREKSYFCVWDEKNECIETLFGNRPFETVAF